ncbi:MAG: hypothetical protein LBK69_03320 [Syntrophomonadaceae bacterium]|jgi:hypothetical protein|nr:hypothetical protein [Syntrophomonadaceae bacterium]
MKRNIIFGTAAFMMLATVCMWLTACGGAGSSGITVQIGVVENNTPTQLSATFREYSGAKTKDITVEAHQTLTIDYSLKSEDGSIVFNVAKDHETLFTAKASDSGAKTFTPSEKTIYTLALELSKATDGEFAITWSVD